jgi:hypothetical protein
MWEVKFSPSPRGTSGEGAGGRGPTPEGDSAGAIEIAATTSRCPPSRTNGGRKMKFNLPRSSGEVASASSGRGRSAGGRMVANSRELGG